MIVLAAAMMTLPATTPTACPDGRTAQGAVTALYDLISVPAGGSWDWERIDGLFVDRGVFVTMMPRNSGTVMAKTDLSTLRTQTQAAYGRSGFVEREYRRKVHVFGDIASIYSSFYIAIPERGSRTLARGLHHFQLVRTQGCWRIVSNISQMEGGSWRLPAAFAPNSGLPTK